MAKVSKSLKYFFKQSPVTAGLCSIALLFPWHSAVASETEINWRAFNNELVTEQVIPAYQSLATSSAVLAKKANALCAANNIDSAKQSLSETKTTFNLTMDAWQRIQHVSFGPIKYDRRGPSMQFWPDKKNHVGKHLARLIQSEADQLKANFTKSGISVKGLPAIERLLYTDKAAEQLLNNSQRCAALKLISQNVNQISQSLAKEWQDYMAPQFADATQTDGFFEDDIDAATALLKTIVEPLEIIRDLKLNRPLGSQLDKAKYKRLESWRSQRSLRNIDLNLNVVEAALPSLKNVLPKQVMVELDAQLKILDQLISNIPTPIEESIRSEGGYLKLKQLSERLTQLHNFLESSISAAGIHLGFNSRDGD